MIKEAGFTLEDFLETELMYDDKTGRLNLKILKQLITQKLPKKNQILKPHKENWLNMKLHSQITKY